MMTLNQFNFLTDAKKGEAILDHGVFLAQRSTNGLKVLLYQVNDFYIEAFLNTKYDLIQGFRAFDTDQHLEPYLQEIDLGDLLAEI